jgi:hypothetical protein
MAIVILYLEPHELNEGVFSTASISNSYPLLIEEHPINHTPTMTLPSERMEGNKAPNWQDDRLPYRTSHKQVRPHRVMRAVEASFSTDMYNRLWFIPNPVDFGYILTDTQETFYVWNAYFVDKYCNTITYSDTDQFSVDGWTAPFNLPTLGLLEYTATAYADGLFQFNVTGTWSFTDEDLIGSFVGARVALFSYTPLWNKMEEELEWSTDILQSVNGKEQRVQARRIPRQSFTFTFFIPDEQTQSIFESLLFQWQKRAFGIPIWGEAELHTKNINAGDAAITVDTAYADFQDNGVAVVWQTGSKYEMVRISTVSPTSLSLQFPLTQTFTGVKYIIPVKVCFVKGKISWKPTPDETATVKASFTVVEPNNISTTYVPQATLGPSGDALPILIPPSLTRKSQKKSSDSESIRLDYEIGEFLIYSDTLFSREKQSIRVRKETKKDCWYHRELLWYLTGRQKPLLVPSNRRDFFLATTVLSSDFIFEVEGDYMAKNYQTNNWRNRVMFRYTDGTYIAREIFGITLNGNNSQIEMTDTLGRTTAPGECTICWLDKVRLFDDSVKIKWEQVGIMESTFDVIQIED